MVVDRGQAYIGSMNLDPRSAVLNTEAGLLIRGPEMAGQVARFIEASMTREQSYLVKIDPDSAPDERKLIWLEQLGGQEIRHAVEPRAGLLRRFLIDMVSKLPIEEDL
jgi:putative cardiolipin synthase